MAFGDVFRGRRVLVTGHTGFKGSWLALWLSHLGAEVAGLSIDVPTSPSHFDLLGLGARLRHYEGDVRDGELLAGVFDEFRPEIVFHLAAQALVRRSYEDPLGTFEVNTLGTLNVLEAIRRRPWVEAGVLITSDKVYRNDEWCWGYREDDRLGGHDPYSGSKACAEVAIHAYCKSFLLQSPTRIATTRAGNVIGGGDWAKDRIVPDCIRAWAEGRRVEIRSPRSTRPWQHVLEPLSGYLWLGSRLLIGQDGLDGEAFNFGPDSRVTQSVAELIEAMAHRWPGASWISTENVQGQVPEATLLKLSCDKALFHMGWHATFDFPETVAFTVGWYRGWHENPNDISALSLGQIHSYEETAASRGLMWAMA